MTAQPRAQSGRPSYEFHSLGWSGFQDLCGTILADTFGQTFQTFAAGNDAGRDGAFWGQWSPTDGEFRGSVTVQCKFSVDPDAAITASTLADELPKAKRLAGRGLADNYVLMTNCRITGEREERLRELFPFITGRFVAYGHEAICRMIHESARLRVLVPRLYGLGDLSQIMDDRAYAQARAILSHMGDGLKTFVITDAYRRAAKAIDEHGFVMLLGEPACGKSTIAGMLAVGALDRWKCRTMKLTTADEFIRHWNPDDPKQLSWVDDAFGPTQFHPDSAVSWSRAFPHMQTAIKKGGKFVFTSRTYIYRAAKSVLKISELPVIGSSQVEVVVDELSRAERERILYNHIRFGSQPAAFKRAIKPILGKIVDMRGFSPESAKRLGAPIFTSRLPLTDGNVAHFLANPVEQLQDTIRTLDAPSRAALALVFANGGSLPAPVELAGPAKDVAAYMGADTKDVPGALSALDGTLFSLGMDEAGGRAWKFRHPSIGEAFSAEVSTDVQFMDVYLAGASLANIFREVSCGMPDVPGVKVVVPANRYGRLLDRIGLPSGWPAAEAGLFLAFLADRCDRAFVGEFVRRHPAFTSAIEVGTYLWYDRGVRAAAKLHAFGLLPENERARICAAVADRTVNAPDAGGFCAEAKSLRTPAEEAGLAAAVTASVIPNLRNMVREVERDWDGESDPEEELSSLKSAMEGFADVLAEDEAAVADIRHGLAFLEETRSEMAERLEQKGEDDADRFDDERGERPEPERSIFDDVDA